MRFNRLALIGMVLLSVSSLLPALGADAPNAGNPNAPIDESVYPAGTKIKVATVGDSITLGIGTTPRPKNATAPVSENAYPMQLARMLGDRYEVKNFPNSGHTLLSKGDKPYSKEKEYQASIDYKADVVIIMLGTNDTKTSPNNWEHKDEFVADYKAFAEKYFAGDHKPRVFVCRPPWVRNDGLGTINENNILLEIPMIDAVAKEMHLGVIDIHAATDNHGEFYAANENVHPNNLGAMEMAKTVYHALTGKEYTGPSTIGGTPAAPRPARPTTATRPAATQATLEKPVWLNREPIAQGSAGNEAK